MIDPMLSLGCRAVSFVSLVAFWVPVMTPAEPPQGRKAAAGQKSDHILAILSARVGHGLFDLIWGNSCSQAGTQSEPQRT